MVPQEQLLGDSFNGRPRGVSASIPQAAIDDMMRDDPTVPVNNGADATGLGMPTDMSAVDFNQPINHGFEDHKMMDEDPFKEQKHVEPEVKKEKPLPVRR